MSSRECFVESFPVEHVEALASSTYSGDIPTRYLRPEVLSEDVLVDGSLQIPIINMGKVMADDNDEMAKLHLACKEWGFFQLMNHGAAQEIIEEMKSAVQEFFKLPLEEKNVYAKPPDSIEGFGQNFLLSKDGKLDWAYSLLLQTQPASARNLRFWPKEPISFREALDKYSTELVKVSECLLKVMAKNLGVDPEQFVNMFVDGRQTVRMNYYPPCMHAGKVIGVTPHSDFGALTLLVQVNEVHGLQIKLNDRWIPIRPVPDAMLVNIGDALEIMSNGEYQSMEHRVAVNPEKERLSVAAFHSPGAGGMIGPLPELITNKTDAIYKSLTRDEYVKFVVSTKRDGRSSKDGMKLKN